MVKVSISLPNNTQITVEADEAEVLREVVSMALRDLPRDLMQAPVADSAQPPGTSTEKRTNVADNVAQSALSAETATPEAGPIVEPEDSPAPSSAQVAPPNLEPAPVSESPEEVTPVDSPAPVPSQEPTEAFNSIVREMPPELLSEERRMNFVAFCREANPLGDMRRVVVAVEGASRHFGIDGANADELVWLFEIAGWRKPGDFTQTLRNAARSKFGWLERIPGRSGRYAATPLGLEKTLVG